MLSQIVRRRLLLIALLLSACGGTARIASRLPAPDKAAPLSIRSTPAPSSGVDVYRSIETSAINPAVAALPPRVYVPNSGAGSVDVIDPKTFAIIGHFDVGQVPHHIAPSYDMTRLYVDNTRGDSLTVVDPVSNRPTGTIPVPDPYNLYFTLDGSRAIVVAERHQRLDFRNAITWALVKSVPIPSSGPDHLDLSADGRYLILSTEFGGDVVKVDVERMEVTGVLHVGGLPVDVKLSPDGTVFYVANQARDGVSMVDAVHMQEIGFLKTARGAHGLTVSRDGASLYVSNRLAGSISVIDFASQSVRATWKVGSSPDMLQVSPDGRQLWASSRFDAGVLVVDAQTGRLIHRIKVGKGAHGLTFFPQPGRFSIGHNGVYR